MRVLDLFSGIGGFSLGLRMAGGFETVQFCEIDPWCRQVLAKNFPGVPIHDDIRTLRFGERPGGHEWRAIERGSEYVGPVDVVVAGFPCQDISSAGKRAGIDGERSGLWREAARIIREVRPSYAILENVSALVVRGLDRVLGDLAEIGYDAEWHCIPASWVGAPHTRDRIWIIAYPQRYEQPRTEPRCWSTGRMGRVEQPISWDRSWQVALSEFRGMDDGVPRSVERTDAIRNAVVPQVVAEIGRAIKAAA